MDFKDRLAEETGSQRMPSTLARHTMLKLWDSIFKLFPLTE